MKVHTSQEHYVYLTEVITKIYHQGPQNLCTPEPGFAYPVPPLKPKLNYWANFPIFRPFFPDFPSEARSHHSAIFFPISGRKLEMGPVPDNQDCKHNLSAGGEGGKKEPKCTAAAGNCLFSESQKAREASVRKSLDLETRAWCESQHFWS